MSHTISPCPLNAWVKKHYNEVRSPAFNAPLCNEGAVRLGASGRPHNVCRLDFLPIGERLEKQSPSCTTPSSKIPSLFLEVSPMGKGKSILHKLHTHLGFPGRGKPFFVFPCAPSGILATGSVFRRECKPGPCARGWDEPPGSAGQQAKPEQGDALLPSMRFRLRVVREPGSYLTLSHTSLDRVDVTCSPWCFFSPFSSPSAKKPYLLLRNSRVRLGLNKGIITSVQGFLPDSPFRGEDGTVQQAWGSLPLRSCCGHGQRAEALRLSTFFSCGLHSPLLPQTCIC